MIYRYLAAFCLLPASFAVYRTPRAWFGAMRTGMIYFFSTVSKVGPQRVLRARSFWKNVWAYYPMRAGQELLRTRSVRATLRKAVETALRRVRLERGGGTPTPRAVHEAVRPLDVGGIRRLAGDPSIRVVSFDIFDTLLERPVLEPRDVFGLVARKVDRLYGVDFVKLRWSAEEELGKSNATIHEIYEHIRQKHQISATTAESLKAAELDFEKRLLAPRKALAAVYEEAVRQGKRVIAVSDMYLPASVLMDFLQAHGYDAVAKVYVSCEFGKRKSDGALYREVLAQEGVEPAQMLHVGDNWISDYVQALENKIVAAHVPAVRELAFAGGPRAEALFGEAAREPIWSLLFGFGLNRLYADPDRAPKALTRLDDMRQFAELALGPLLAGLCLTLANDREVQEGYTRLSFASRDGYLPSRVYALVGRYRMCIPGSYVWAGRRAQFPWLAESFESYASGLQRVGDPQSYTLGDLLETHFCGTELLARLKMTLPPEALARRFFEDKEGCLGMLKPFAGEIEDTVREQRQRAKRYYDSAFGGDGNRICVFDLGYSGSVGKALTASTGKPADKVYFWEEPENRALDASLGTRTRVFMREQGFLPYNLMLEEVFSPCEGGVVGFDAQSQPLFEPFTASAAMRADMDALHGACLAYVEALCVTLGEDVRCVELSELDPALRLFRTLFAETPGCNGRLFINIVFPDPLHRDRPLSLEKKMEAHLPQITVFSGTGFEDPTRVCRAVPPLLPGHGRLGIHLHLHHLVQCDELLRYLQDFPAPFDLYVTLHDAAFASTARALFCRALLPRLERAQVLVVPNRGRDVAPWVLGMRPFQAEYDLFCHIHTKASEHTGFGDAWRRYLLDNLIRAEGATAMLNHFTMHPEVGCLFPAIYPDVRALMAEVGVPLYGSEEEYALIAGLLQRMGLQGEVRRSELMFAVGTMQWYRPAALRQLFACELTLEDFAPEPLGVGGSLAHALERVPALLAERNGYRARSLTSTPLQ